MRLNWSSPYPHSARLGARLWQFPILQMVWAGQRLEHSPVQVVVLLPLLLDDALHLAEFRRERVQAVDQLQVLQIDG